MENEKIVETPQPPVAEGAESGSPTPRRRHRRPSHRNAAAASAVQTGPASAVQPESAAAAATSAVAVAAASTAPAAPEAPAVGVPSVPAPASGESVTARPVRQSPAQRPTVADERQKASAPQRLAGTSDGRRGPASQKATGQQERKPSVSRNPAANGRKSGAERRAVESPKRLVASPKRSATSPKPSAAAERHAAGGWSWRGSLCRLSAVVLGAALTLLGAELIGRWQESRQVRGAMQAVYEELAVNRTAVGMTCRSLMRDGQGLRMLQRNGVRVRPSDSLAANPMLLRVPTAAVLRDEAWQVLCASGVMASVRDGELLRDVAGCYADMARFARQLEAGDATDPGAAQLGRSTTERIDRVLRQLEGKYGFGQ